MTTFTQTLRPHSQLPIPESVCALAPSLMNASLEPGRPSEEDPVQHTAALSICLWDLPCSHSVAGQKYTVVLLQPRQRPLWTCMPAAETDTSVRRSHGSLWDEEPADGIHCSEGTRGMSEL